LASIHCTGIIINRLIVETEQEDCMALSDVNEWRSLRMGKKRHKKMSGKTKKKKQKRLKKKRKRRRKKSK